MSGGPKREIKHNIDFSEFSYSYTCIIIYVIVFLMTCPRDTSIYNKINSFGVLFIAIIIVFTIGIGVDSITNTTYTTDEDKAKESTSYIAYISLFSAPFNNLMGILGGGYYFHNISLSVVRNARNPENNVRDVFLGYLATFLTYVICGSAGYYGFTGSKFEAKLDDNDGLIE